ncbi:hypothetical protein HPB52_009721 [Rhipicephalus sanguineus]|uniref:Uncharacterized protein n=1 Tax=Rhipicephalus sanguineus TaxID=34632 RepID=A0A9D4SNY3_RHISA|nr:hypothetical protein HPB52_009721 [Rhipicephalus sanguineus]
MSEVSALCEALTTLAQQLLADDCYDRVQLGPWTEPYLKILSPVLASSLSSAEQILLPDIGGLSLDSVSALCNTLASNRRVSHVIIAVREEPDARVALLCEALKKNRYIERPDIRIEKADSAKDILCALTINASVTFLSITLRGASDEENHGSAFQTCMSLRLQGKVALKFLDSIAKAMPRNKLIVNFNSRVDYRIYVPSSILESCFELFVGRPCMMTHLTVVARITDVEALLKVVAAEHRIQENYFVPTGIVRRHIVCWPADVKQVDTLNPVCWRAIASLLGFTDVCFQ